MSVSLSIERYSDSSTGVWASLNRLLLTLIIVVSLGALCYSFWPDGSRRRDLLVKIEALKAVCEKEEQVLARNTRRAELLQRDPEYMGLVARDKLDLVGPNEKVYRIDPAAAAPGPAPAKTRP